MVGAGCRAAAGTGHAVTSPNRAVGGSGRAEESVDRAVKVFCRTGNLLDFAEKETRRPVTGWRDWRREIGDARVAAVTLTIVPKDIEARILIAYRKTVNRFLSFSYHGVDSK
jgi:hypothetical protein